MTDCCSFSSWEKKSFQTSEAVGHNDPCETCSLETISESQLKRRLNKQSVVTTKANSCSIRLKEIEPGCFLPALGFVLMLSVLNAVS